MFSSSPLGRQRGAFKTVAIRQIADMRISGKIRAPAGFLIIDFF